MQGEPGGVQPGGYHCGGETEAGRREARGSQAAAEGGIRAVPQFPHEEEEWSGLRDAGVGGSGAGELSRALEALSAIPDPHCWRDPGGDGNRTPPALHPSRDSHSPNAFSSSSKFSELFIFQFPEKLGIAASGGHRGSGKWC